MFDSSTAVYYGGLHITINSGDDRTLEALKRMEDTIGRIDTATSTIEKGLPRIAEDVIYVKKMLDEWGETNPRLKLLADRLENAASFLQQIDAEVPDREPEDGGGEEGGGEAQTE